MKLKVKSDLSEVVCSEKYLPLVYVIDRHLMEESVDCGILEKESWPFRFFLRKIHVVYKILLQ